MIRFLETDTQISGPIELVSRGGIGIYTKEKVKKGAKVVLKIFCDIDNRGLEYSIPGTVRTEEKKKEFGSIGIQFDKEINSLDQPELFNYLVAQERIYNDPA